MKEKCSEFPRIVSGTKKDHTPKVLSPDVFRGPKSSVRPSKPGKSNFLAGMSRDFAGISWRCPTSSRNEKVCVLYFRPLLLRLFRALFPERLRPLKINQKFAPFFFKLDLAERRKKKKPFQSSVFECLQTSFDRFMHVFLEGRGYR